MTTDGKSNSFGIVLRPVWLFRVRSARAERARKRKRRREFGSRVLKFRAILPTTIIKKELLYL